MAAPSALFQPPTLSALRNRSPAAISGWFFNLYLNQPKLPKLVSEIRGDKLLLRWETPKDYPFPMPLEIEVNGQIERIEMPNGQAELNAARYAKARLDPRCGS